MKEKQIRLGILMTYLMGVAQILVNILFTGTLVRFLDHTEYALYLLLGSLAAYVSIFDFGLNNTVSRYVAKYRAEQDREKESNLLCLTFLLYTIIAVVLFTGGLALMGHISFFIKDLQPEYLGLAKTLFLLLIINIAITLPLNSFSAILVGYEQFIYTRTVSILRVLAMPLISIPILIFGGGSVAVVTVTTVTNVTAGIFNAVHAFRACGIRLKFYYLDRALAKEVLNYSVAVFMGVVADQFFFNSGNLVLGITRGANDISVFGVSIQLTQYLIAVAAAFTGVFLPRATRLAVNGSSTDIMNRFFREVSRLLAVLLLYIMGGYALLGREFVHFWLKGSLSDVYAVSLLIMIPTLWTLSRAVGLSIMQAKNLHGFRSKLLVARAIVNILISFPAARRFGYWGTAISYVFCILLTNWILDTYYERRVGIFVGSFSFSLLPAGFSALFAAGIAGLTYLIIDYSVPAFLFRGILYSALFAFFVYHLFLSAKEKEKIRLAIRVKLIHVPDYGGQS